jgi:S1-C subfamily serine protease
VVAVNVISASGARRGLGSGAIVRPDGIVLTNYHVVRGTSQIDVSLSDQTHYAGQVVGTDPQSDLALVRLVDAPADLPAIPLGDSAALQPGQLAIAIGNPNGLERSVTVGVISGVNRTLRPNERPLRDVIQTDAAINPGNSGGPLLNSNGELVGINTAIETVSGQRGFGGIGYAVPAATVARYLDRMLAGEKVEHSWLGVSGSDVTPAVARAQGLPVTAGVLLDDTVADSPARTAGLRKGDVIVAVDGKAIRTMDDLGDAIDRARRPGDTIVAAVARGREQVDVAVTLGAWPERLPAAAR